MSELTVEEIGNRILSLLISLDLKVGEAVPGPTIYQTFWAQNFTSEAVDKGIKFLIENDILYQSPNNSYTLKKSVN